MRQYEHLREALGREPDPDAQRLYEEVRSRRTSEPELTSELWERVGELRVGSGDIAGAVAAFELAIGSADSSDATARLHRKTAGAWLAQHDAAAAEEHLGAAEGLATLPAERARLVLLRANQAWAQGELDRAGEAWPARARPLAEADGEPEDVAAVDETFAIISHMRGDWRRGLQLEIGRTSAAASSLARVFDIHHCIGQYHLLRRQACRLTSRTHVARRWCLAEAKRRGPRAGGVRLVSALWASRCCSARALGSRQPAVWSGAASCTRRSMLTRSKAYGSGSPSLVEPRRARPRPPRLLRRASALAATPPMAMHMWG